MAPKKLPARPTTDYAKEALFNILQQEVNWSDSVLVDLFAGIGSISFEALSRGAHQVFSVDSHYATVRWLEQTGQDLQVSARFTPIKADALVWIKQTNIQPTIIFADPPYDFDAYLELILLIKDKFAGRDLLFVLEHRQNLTFDDHPNIEQSRTYGEVGFSFFRF